MAYVLLRNLCENVHTPIYIGGDFNEILSYDEKEGDCIRSAIPEFWEMLDDCDLKDLGFEGQWYTWEHGLTAQTRVRERLDIFLGNHAWCARFPEAVVSHLVRFKIGSYPDYIASWGAKKEEKQQEKDKKKKIQIWDGMVSWWGVWRDSSRGMERLEWWNYGG